MSKGRVLLIDDEQIFSNNLKSFLELHEYECEVVSNGKQGLQTIEQWSPDIIVLDVLMPHMDGFTMLRELKRKDMSVPCIVVSARQKLKDLFEVEDVARFLCKPISMEEIEQNIRNVIDEKKE